MSGSIPSEFASMKSLQNILDLSHNRLFGSLPTELGLLTGLSKFLSYMIPIPTKPNFKLLDFRILTHHRIPFLSLPHSPRSVVRRYQT